MRAVAEGLVAGVLAPAPGDHFLFRDFDLYRRETRSLVRAIAVGLVLRVSAGAPKLVAGFFFDLVGKSLRDMWFIHGVIPFHPNVWGATLIGRFILTGPPMLFNGFYSFAGT
jgi:hypothetical protein